MRLIDEDRAKDILVRYLNAPHIQQEMGGMAIAIDTCIRLLENCPTIDAVPVVRCKDCQAWQENPWSKGEMVCKCWADWLPTEPNDFCSCGEPKDGASNVE